MTAYIAITDAETDPEAPLTSELAKKWRDNPIAISEGSTGAPKVQRAAVQDAAINRVKLSTGTNSGSYSFSGSGGTTTISLDAYSFFPSHSGNADSVKIEGGGASADLPAITFSDLSTASGTVRWRYILA